MRSPSVTSMTRILLGKHEHSGTLNVSCTRTSHMCLLQFRDALAVYDQSDRPDPKAVEHKYAEEMMMAAILPIQLRSPHAA